MQDSQFFLHSYELNFQWPEEDQVQERRSLIKDANNNDLRINSNDLEENLAGTSTPPSTR